MQSLAQHTIYLQDGRRYSFRKQFERQGESLVRAMRQVADGRKRYGKRHELCVILLIVFGGITQGSQTLKDSHLWAVHNKKWLQNYLPLPHGIPDPTTVSRALQQVEMESLVTAYVQWQQVLSGRTAAVASFDGKTLNGVHGRDVVKHVLSLFTHETHQVLAQVGVDQKENEIPAVKRLLSQTSVAGMLLLGDALHTQKETAKEIIANHAAYLLVVKENQEQLLHDLELLFADPPCSQESATSDEYGHSRYVTTTVSLMTDPAVLSYFTGWEHLAGVGKLMRVGTRQDKGNKTPVSETIFFLTSSQTLTASDAATHLRKHWTIENNLHWQKDYTFLEDRHTLRRGNAPLVMTFLRSMAIGLFASSSFASVSTAIANFQKNPSLHHLFLTTTCVL